MIWCCLFYDTDSYLSSIDLEAVPVEESELPMDLITY